MPIPSLDDSDKLALMEKISLQEVQEAVFSLPKNSAPGPDGFHAEFFQKNWNLVHKDVYDMVINT